MMMPSIREHFMNGLMDPWEDMFQFSRNLFDRGECALPRTDIKEVNGGYELDMELPGVRKEDVHAKLENGYLTIQADQNHSKDEKDENGNFIRRERYQGMVSRSFYVGPEVREEDINAKFEQGILHVTFPKIEKENSKEGYIRIEG